MNKKAIEKNWVEIKEKIQAKWSKLNDEELEVLRNDLGQLAIKVQKAYGTAKEHTEKEFEDFKKSVSALITQDSPEKKKSSAPPPKISWVIGSQTTPTKPKAIKGH